MKITWIDLVAGAGMLALGFWGCSEANNAATGNYTSYDAGSDTGHASPSSGDDDSSTPVMPHEPDATANVPNDAGTPTGTDGGLVINEVNGKESDFAELFNAGTGPIDLTGWGVTEAKQGDAGLGAPKDAAIFPAGSVLAAGDYALILGAPKDGGTPIACPTSVVCLQATWNISNTDGAQVSLLSPTSAVVAQAALPAGVTGKDQSWGRLPNGIGSFQLNSQTPGAVNAGP